MTPYEKVKAARNQYRPQPSDFIERIFTDFTEFHGDRRYGDDKAVKAGIAYLDGMPITVAALQKGKDLAERLKTNFGSAHPEGYRKALRLFKQAEKFNRPVICFIDTPGAYPGIGAEERGQGQAIAEMLREMLVLKVPTVSIITGEGGSGGALAFAVTDEVYMLENSVYSVISPEGCSGILFKDNARVAEAAACLKLTAKELLTLGVIDKVFKEDMPFYKLCIEISSTISAAIKKNKKLTTEALLNNRYNKFRNIGCIYTD